MDSVFGFFKFSYYILTNNKKKYKYAVDNMESIIFTPILFMVIHMIVGLILIMATGSLVGILTIFIHVPIAVGSFMIQDYHSDRYYEIEIERIRAEHEERIRQERIRRFREEYERKAREEYERMQEERRREAEREWREYAQWYERERKKRESQQRQNGYYYDRHNNQYHHRQYRQQTTYSGSSQLIDSLRTLGLDGTATKKDIKSAYRKLSRKHHPDVGGKHEDFVRINKAYKYAMDNV